jgi:hypothetical protein
MAYNGKFTTYLGVVESAFRDSGLDLIDYEAATEWTAELIGLIGSPYLLIDKVTNGLNGMPSSLVVEDYRAELPEDMEVFISARKVILDDNDEIVSASPMVEASDLFHFTPSQINSGVPGYFGPVVNLDEFDPSDENFIASRNQYTVEQSDRYTSLPAQYKLDSGYIYTNFDSGNVQLSYRGFPIDSNGYPMIPDEVKFREALKYYIIYKIDWKNWRINPSSQNKSIVNDSEQRYLFAVASARNKSHIPSVDKMESIKNMWLRSIPKVNEHSTGFRTTNISERRYNNSFRRNNRRAR